MWMQPATLTMSKQSACPVGHPLFTVVVALTTTYFLVAELLSPHHLDWSGSPFILTSTSLSPSPCHKIDQTVTSGASSRSGKFETAGVAAYSVVVTGASRSGPAVWEILILVSGPVAKHDDGSYSCQWISAGGGERGNGTRAVVTVEKPGLGYKQTYTPIVIKCEFPTPVGSDGLGGNLVLHAKAIDMGQVDESGWLLAQPEAASDRFRLLKVLAATEKPGDYNAINFEPPYAYKHLYCGSPLYGNLHGPALHEWLSFHLYGFGNRSHFILHDAGGLSKDVRRVLSPWVDLGILTIEDVRDLNQFDGYYHNQYLILNDCLVKSRYMAEWVWFFDVDEYIVVKPPFTDINQVLEKYRNVGEVQFEQRLFSSSLCPLLDTLQREDKWTIETLLFAVKGGSTYSKHKWAANPRKISAASVHFAMPGARHKKSVVNSSEASYFHYHNSINRNTSELCQQWVNRDETKNLSARFNSGMEALEYDDSILKLSVKARNHTSKLLRRQKEHCAGEVCTYKVV